MREHDPGSEYIIGNYLKMEFANAFDIITLIYYDYGALIPVERQDLLRRVHKALKPNGLFLFDVYTVLKGRGRRDSTTWSVNPTGGFMSSEPHICFEGECIYGETAEGCRTVIIGESGVRCYNLWDCYFTKQTLLEEATPFGFTEYGFYNDATGTPYTEDSQTLCAILKKTGD